MLVIESTPTLKGELNFRAAAPKDEFAAPKRSFSGEMASVPSLWRFATDCKGSSTGSRSSPRARRIYGLTRVSVASEPSSRFFSRSRVGVRGRQDRRILEPAPQFNSGRTPLVEMRLDALFDSGILEMTHE